MVTYPCEMDRTVSLWASGLYRTFVWLSSHFDEQGVALIALWLAMLCLWNVIISQQKSNHLIVRILIQCLHGHCTQNSCLEITPYLLLGTPTSNMFKVF